MTSKSFESPEYQYCLQALKNVSRSFALTIPMIEESIRTPILIGYLEARVLDSFEDEYLNQISKEKRAQNLDEAFSIIKNPELKGVELNLKKITQSAPEYISHPHYLDLVQNFEKIIRIHRTLNSFEKKTLVRWLNKMVQGMKKFLEKKIDSFEQLDEYCYYVGGTIGGFLTDLLIKNAGKIPAKQIKTLKSFYADFGIFLQKVNIIRDFREDVLKNKRVLWPQDSLSGHGLTPLKVLDRKYEVPALAFLEQMLTNAHKHINPIQKYISALPPDFPGFKKAFSINFQMGVETLKKLKGNPAVFYAAVPVKIEKKVKREILSQYL